MLQEFFLLTEPTTRQSIIRKYVVTFPIIQSFQWVGAKSHFYSKILRRLQNLRKAHITWQEIGYLNSMRKMMVKDKQNTYVIIFGRIKGNLKMPCQVEVNKVRTTHVVFSIWPIPCLVPLGYMKKTQGCFGSPPLINGFSGSHLQG